MFRDCISKIRHLATEVPSLGIHLKGGEFLFIPNPVAGQLHLKGLDYGFASGAVVAVMASVKKTFLAELVSLITN